MLMAFCHVFWVPSEAQEEHMEHNPKNEIHALISALLKTKTQLSEKAL